MKKILCDLDGTLALNEHREHFIHGENKDWEAFFKACVHDELNVPIFCILEDMSRGREIIIVSGRSDEVLQETVQWLDLHQVPYSKLIMRQKGDYTPDHELKKRWIDKYNWTPDDVIFVLDDRDSVVKMWRANGFTCLQVAEGDF